MSIRGKKKGRAFKFKKTIPTQKLLKKQDVLAPISLKQKLDKLDLPLSVVNTILDAKTNVNNIELPLFRQPRIVVHGESIDRGSMLLLQEAISVYYHFQEENEDDALEKFQIYIKTLINIEEKRQLNDTHIPDGLVFESPYLSEIRRQEQILSSLEVRKKKAIKGIKCGKCKHDGVHVTEKYIRSGDEPAVEFYVCEACEHDWKK